VISATHEQEPTDALKRAEVALGRLWRSPSFEPALEQQYEAYSSERRNRTLRFWLLFGLVLRVLGLATEFSIGGDMPVYGLVFRLGILPPVVLVSLWFLSPRYSLLTQGVAATAAPFLCVVGLALLGAAAPHPNEIRYFFLVGVNIVALNIVMPLRFRHAVAFTVASMTVYLSMALSGLGGVDPWSGLDIVFMYSMASIASLVVAYRNEIIDRRAFLASERINAQAKALAHANEELQRLLTMDALTGVYNRRYLDRSLKESAEAAIADRTHLGVLMVDVDHFKSYNDLFGHRAGDECLREVARTIVATVRSGTDIVTRYGGEEFAVLAPGLPPKDTEVLGERIRAAVEALAIPHPRAGGAKVTISVGTAAAIPEGADTLDRLINEADGALYRSKHLGRNRVTLAGAALDRAERADEVQSAA
jgi:diguanylate cyclase (GGDEF)-like protein